MAAANLVGRFFSRPVLSICAFVVAACGGGADPEPANSGPVAYYSDSFYRGNRAFNLMLFHGGMLYGFYANDFLAMPSEQFSLAGFTVARLTTLDDSNSTNPTDPTASTNFSYRGFDYDFERGMALPLEVGLRYQATGWYQGSLSIPDGSTQTFQAIYEPASVEPTQAGKLAHRYGGYMRSVTESALVRASLDADGNISASTDGGCAVAGILKARPLGNLYDATVTVGASCPVPAGRYAGPALQSFNSTNVYLMLTMEDLSHGLVMHLFE